MTSPNEMIAVALGAHSIPHEQAGDSIAVSGTGMTFYAEALPPKHYPNSVLIQLNVATQAPLLSGRTLWQCFAGWGDSEYEALTNAFSKFLRGPFHVLLCALADHDCDSQPAEWFEWRGPAGDWDACDSALVTQGAEDPASIPFREVIDGIEAAFTVEASLGVHWVDVFFAFVGGKRSVAEVKLDGESWPEGQKVIDRWQFTATANYTSGRYFLIAFPKG